ncbi:DUF4432 family protein [Shinella zoogloeoides]|uniref:DUF4432 family protein n=1 Tax=Shinella zoogloeoides TaxID=352475 RepID=A0A6N8TBJ4_SHIZO|nr:DUF4432 family protein [Shinella zoogloeoides]MXO00662.1 DUF4432 family protein [Shinella zoogloeoides]UEX80091.1 DUF4432 family protein [Shinella zoogloeoides]
MPFALAADTPDQSFRLDLTAHSALDVASAVFHGVDIAPGSAIPSDGDPRIDKALPGFLFTCGPDHIRHPVPVEGAADGRRYPLHGSLSSHPARDIAIEEDEGEAICEGRVAVALAHGGTADLARRWRADRRTGHISLDDAVTNTGDRPWPPFAMYHINFGTGLFDENTRLTGAMLPGGSLPWRFDDGDMKIFCVPVTETAEHGWAEIAVGPIAALGGRSVHIRFRTDTLPYLQVWRNQSPGCAVLGIEPVSHRLASREELIASGEAPDFAPGESVGYALAFEVR